MNTPYSDKLWDSVESFSPGRVTTEIVIPRLIKQLRYVQEMSPFYRKKLKNMRIPDNADILAFHNDLPFTEKAELLDDQQSFPPFGSNLTVDITKVQRINKTSGSTGAPMILALTTADIACTTECGARCFYASGLRSRHVVVHCMNYCMWAGGYTDHGSLEATGAAVVPFGVGNSKTLIETLVRLRPHALHATPSYLAKLETILKNDYGLEPAALGLELGLFGGEAGLQDPNFRRQIESTWGFRAMNANYGMADVLSMFGAECQCRSGLHFVAQDVLYPGLIDPQTLAPLPLQQGARGEMIITNLARESQPVVRYRTRDLIEILSTDCCECGRYSFRFKLIGRSDDMIVIKGINVFPFAVESVINKNLVHLNGQYDILISKTDPIDRFLIRAETSGEYPDKEVQTERLAAQFVSQLAIRPEILLVPEGTIERSENKTKRIKRIL